MGVGVFGYRVSVLQCEKVLEMNGADVWMTMEMCSMP